MVSKTVEGYAMGIAETLDTDTDTDTGSAASCGVVQDGFIAGGDTGNVYSQASNRVSAALCAVSNFKTEVLSFEQSTCRFSICFRSGHSDQLNDTVVQGSPSESRRKS